MVELARKRCEGPLVEIRSGNLTEPPSLQEKRERLALTLAAQSAVAVTSRAGLPAPRPCKRSEVEAGLCQPLRLVAAFAVAFLAFDHTLAATLWARGSTSIGRNHRPASSPRVSRGCRSLGSTGTACAGAARVHKVGSPRRSHSPLLAKVVWVLRCITNLGIGALSAQAARLKRRRDHAGRRPAEPADLGVLICHQPTLLISRSSSPKRRARRGRTGPSMTRAGA